MKSSRTSGIFAFMAIALAPIAALAHEGHEHGDHNPRHGGFVLMYKDVHVEVVALPQGGVQVYYTDEQRRALPAATASDVVADIEMKGKAAESLAMAISAGGDFWEGKSKPIATSLGVVHLAFLLHGESVVVDLPLASVLKKKAATPAATAKKPAQQSATEHH